MTNHSTSSRRRGATSPLAALTHGLSRYVALGEEERQAIEALPHWIREAAKGERLVRPGQVEESCYLLLDAFAHKEKFWGGTRRVVAVNLPGEILNIESVLALQSDYGGDILRAGRIAAVSAEALRSLAFAMPQVAEALWLCSQAEGALYREWLLNDRRDLRSRIAHLLCETDARLQRLSTAQAMIVPLDPAELAQAVAAARHYVERQLAALEAAGMIAVTTEAVTVRDRAALAEIAGFDPSYLLGVEA
jgi:CRP-like cAMP-binding protein